jgi:hypothetical protein
MCEKGKNLEAKTPTWHSQRLYNLQHPAIEKLPALPTMPTTFGVWLVYAHRTEVDIHKRWSLGAHLSSTYSSPKHHLIVGGSLI